MDAGTGSRYAEGSFGEIPPEAEIVTLTLITPTGGRPEAFGLLERWIGRQTWKDPIQWIVVDDVLPNTPLHLGQEPVYPSPKWHPGLNTQKRNIHAALPLVRGELILFVEDDDWYHSTYLAMMVERLRAKALVVGEKYTRYYQLKSRLYEHCGNDSSASLFQMGMHRTHIPNLENALRRPGHIDVQFCRQIRGELLMMEPSSTSVGIKGMPGRPGIGSGHAYRKGFKHDPDGTVFRKWLGNDSEHYKEYL